MVSSCYCHSLSSQPPPVRVHTHTHTGKLKPVQTHAFTYAHSLSNTHTHTHTHTHTQSRHEPRSMGSRVTLAPCFIKGAVTIGLLLLWRLRGHNETECAGLMLPCSSTFFTWWQGGQTETGQHVIRGRPWRWVGSLQGSPTHVVLREGQRERERQTCERIIYGWLNFDETP